MRSENQITETRKDPLVFLGKNFSKCPNCGGALEQHEIEYGFCLRCDMLIEQDDKGLFFWDGEEKSYYEDFLEAKTKYYLEA